MDRSPDNHWMPLEKEIKIAINSIAKTTGIKEQRNHFQHRSLHLTNVVELFEF